MPALFLCYDSCVRRKPRYLKKPAIESVAREARAQLLPAGTDALTLERLAEVSELNINSLPYQLWVSLDHPVTDEAGQPVLGLCEFDPDCGEDAVSVLVSPVGEQLTPELALSTFAHELGHAIFDAPAWLIAAKQGPGLFDDPDTSQRRAYRTATPDADHLGATALPQNTALEKEIRIAEFRANEFMGSLLVPRDRLVELAVARAPDGLRCRHRTRRRPVRRTARRHAPAGRARHLRLRRYGKPATRAGCELWREPQIHPCADGALRASAHSVW